MKSSSPDNAALIDEIISQKEIVSIKHTERRTEYMKEGHAVSTVGNQRMSAVDRRNIRLGLSVLTAGLL